MMGSFDKEAKKKFNDKLKEEVDRDRLIQSLNPLRIERNSLAHGKSTTISLQDVLNYFRDSRRIIKILDDSLYINDDLTNFSTLFSNG